MKPEFKDRTGRTWKTAVNVNTIRRVLSSTGINLATLTDGGGDKDQKKILHRILTEPLLSADVLWSVVEPDAVALNMSAQDFGECLEGDVLISGIDALINGLVLFAMARNPSAGQVLAKTVELARKTERALWEKAESELDSKTQDIINQALDNFDKLMRKQMSTTSAGDLLDK